MLSMCIRSSRSLAARRLLLGAFFAAVLAVASPAMAQTTPAEFDPAALLGSGKEQIAAFVVSIAPVVIGLIILTAGFKKVLAYVRRMFKSA